jgi:hypothetical protein
LAPNEEIEIKATGSVHLSLQGKGGVGKSLVASILAQYLNRKAQAVRCIHPDPANKTRSEYKGLQTPLQLFREKLRAASKRLFGHAVITGAQSPRTNSLCGAMLGPERPKITTTNVRFSTGTKGGEHQ